APADIAEVVAALERFGLSDFSDDFVRLFGCRRLAYRGPERADVELTAIGEILIRLVMPGAHAASARIEPRCDAHRIQFVDELAGIREPRIFFEERNFRRDERHATGTSYHTGDPAVCVFLDLRSEERRV